MRKTKKLQIAILLSLNIIGTSLLNCGVVHAAENSDYEKELSELKARMTQLEAQIKQNQDKAKDQNKKQAKKDDELPKFRVEGDTYASTEYHSTKNSSLNNSNHYTGQLRIRFISGTPQDDIFFYSEATTNFTAGESDNALSGDSPYFSQAYFKFNRVLGLDSIRIGRSGGDCLGVGGPIDRPTNYDGIKLTKKIGATTFDFWTGNYTAETNGDDTTAVNQMTTLQASFDPSKAIHASVGYWSNPHSFHNTTAGQWINAGVGAGYDGQQGLNSTLHWKIGHGFNFLSEVTYASLNNPTGGLKKHPMGIASMLYWTKAEMRPGLFPNIAELADWHQPGTFAVGLIYGSNDAASGPYGIYNCADFANGSIYGSGNNVNVLMLRGEYVLRKGVLAYVRIARATLKDKSLRADQEYLGGDNYIGAGIKLFF